MNTHSYSSFRYTVIASEFDKRTGEPVYARMQYKDFGANFLDVVKQPRVFVTEVVDRTYALSMVQLPNGTTQEVANSNDTSARARPINENIRRVNIIMDLIAGNAMSPDDLDRFMSYEKTLLSIGWGPEVDYMGVQTLPPVPELQHKYAQFLFDKQCYDHLAERNVAHPAFAHVPELVRNHPDLFTPLATKVSNQDGELQRDTPGDSGSKRTEARRPRRFVSTPSSR